MASTQTQLERLRAPIQRGRRFLEEAWSELKKVHWPARRETVAATGVVIVVVFITAAWLGLVDAVLAWMLSGIIGP